MTNCSDVYGRFFEPGEVTEIRAYGCRGKNRGWSDFATNIVYGYFDNPDDFGKAAMALEAAKVTGIYFTMNPVIPDLLARSANRLRAAKKEGVCTADRHVLCLRWLYVDLDPIRPARVSDISVTDKELEAAEILAKRIAKWMEGESHWPPAIRAHSGNGVHLLYRLPELPNDVEGTGENVAMLKACLAALADKFDNKWVDVDRKTFNPARICKIYGTTARKGDDTELRPWRKSFLD